MREMRDYGNTAKALRCCRLTSARGCAECPYRNDNNEKCAHLLPDAADAIEELLAAVPHWISVEERLPTDEDGDPWDRCIVYTDEDTIQTLPLCKVGNGYVTHWPPLPEPPKEVE